LLILNGKARSVIQVVKVVKLNDLLCSFEVTNNTESLKFG